MSIEGMLCAVGVALLAAGVLARARLASAPGSVATVVDDGPAASTGTGRLDVRSSPVWRASTVASWSGVVLLVGAGVVVLAELWLFFPSP